MNDTLELAYLAGVLDSDGFISIRQQATNPRYPDSFTFTEWCGVGQVSPAAVELFHARWGGTVNIRTRKTEGDWRPMHYWVVTNRVASACVADLRPYLRIKVRQAELLLGIRASKNRPWAEQRTAAGRTARSRSLDPEILAARTAAWREVRSLNEKRRFPTE